MPLPTVRWGLQPRGNVPRKRAGCSSPAAPWGRALMGAGDPSQWQQGPSSPCEAQAPGCHGWGIWEGAQQQSSKSLRRFNDKKTTDQKRSGVSRVSWQMGRCLKFWAEAVKAEVQKVGGGLGS